MNPDEVSFDARPRTRSRLPLVVLALLVAFVAGIALTQTVLAPTLARWGWGSATDDRQPVATALPAPAAQPSQPPGADLSSLYAREIALAARIQGLEARLANIDSDSRVASTFATRAEGLLVAFAARRALDRGLPLGYIEEQLRQRFGQVEPRAVAVVVRAGGAPVTLEDLRLALDTLAPDLRSGVQTGNWWNALRREVVGLVALRQEGTPSAQPAERLTRARRMLDAGHVEGALAEIARMPGVASAGSWMDAARRYIDARRALNLIEAAAIQGVDPPAPPLGLIPAPTPPPRVEPQTN